MSGNFSRRAGCLHNNNNNNIPYHTIPYHTIPYHTIPYHTIPYHTIPYHIAESPPANPRFFLEGAHEPRGHHRVFSAKPDEAPTGDPPPAWVGARDNRQPPPPSPPKKGTPARRVGDIVPCRAAMSRHGPTPGDTRPPPPPRSRGAPVVPRAESNPPPPPSRSGRPREPSPSPRGPLRIRPRASTALKPLHPPAAALGPARSPPRRPTHYRDPGLGAPVPSPARPPGVPPAGPVPVRFGREGTVWHSPRLHQDSPPWMVLGRIRPRRAGCGPHRRPQPPRHQQRPGLPGRLWPAPAAHPLRTATR